jgi:hypothetical protein
VDNRVIDSASIEVNRRQRRTKTDRLDAGKLLNLLLRYHGGEGKVWSVVRVPSAPSRLRIGVADFVGCWETCDHTEVSHEQEVHRSSVG